MRYNVLLVGCIIFIGILAVQKIQEIMRLKEL